MAREAVDSNAVDEFLSALDQRPGKSRKAAPSFADFAQEWLDTRVKGAVRESQVQSDESILRCHLLPAFGRRNLDNIRARDIEKYLAKKRAETSPRGSAYSSKSLRNHLGVLNRILTSALDYELITKNPITRGCGPNDIRRKKT
ncbi:MAG: hypothetical protein KC416_12220 [Myxococcales bacterium]|nr:hypothetical protein [Myxococcales bacterium]